MAPPSGTCELPSAASQSSWVTPVRRTRGRHGPPPEKPAILRQLIPEEVRFGEWEEGTWSTSHGVRAKSLYNLWEPCRYAKEPRAPNLDEALSCAAALAKPASGRMGARRCPAQPLHHRACRNLPHRSGSGARRRSGRDPTTSDTGAAWSTTKRRRSRESILESGTAVPTKEADVYALGASLFISATGRRHVSYPDDAGRKVQRQAIVDKPHRPINVPGAQGRLIERHDEPRPGRPAEQRRSLPRAAYGTLRRPRSHPRPPRFRTTSPRGSPGSARAGRGVRGALSSRGVEFAGTKSCA